MKTATTLRQNLPDFRGTAHLYKLDPPYLAERYDFTAKYGEGEECFIEEVTYVVCSAVNAHGTGAETFAFRSNEKGEVEDWGELPMSISGIYDPEAILIEDGYTIIPLSLPSTDDEGETYHE